MEVLFHLVFILIKTAAISLFYGSVFLLILWLARKWQSFAFVKVWLYSSFLFFVSLMFFFNTYWGDHELGDVAQIPVGYGQYVQQINGNECFIEPDNYSEGLLRITEYQQHKHFICGHTNSSQESRLWSCFVWNLKTNKVQFFKKQENYISYANMHFMPLVKTFKSFRYHYKQHWLGWRFWLLA